ncbi:CoA transferase [Mesobacillus harenae]|uniref:CoA transferase n=1 Tax=Mesobacillus harenae TaxID=2213203 RepID=UPI0015801559
MNGALDGIKILDLTRVLAGPHCTMIMADLGADVIKVEAPPESDETRGWGPPFQEGVSAYYLCANRNKRSITVNLKTEEGRGIIRQLVEKSDVLIHNFKTGSMENWGLDYPTLKALNEKLIFCSITGFGETGPYSHLPGYDFIVQGLSGLMDITGTKESGPVKVGVAMVDILTGLYSAIAIQAALLEREKSGQGQKIDMALLDTAVSSLANVASSYLMTKEVPERLGNDHPNIAPYSTFKTSDGHLILTIGNDGQFQSLCKVLRIEELALDKKFSINEARVKNREELRKVLEHFLRTKTRDHWIKLFSEHNIPCGPINTLDQVFTNPQVTERGMLIQMEHPEAGKINLVGSPIKLSRTKVKMVQYPPVAGEHTIEVLRGLGITNEKITELKKRNII